MGLFIILCLLYVIQVDVERLRNHSQWDDLYARVLATSQSCSTSWSGISAQYKLTILEQLRTLNAGNGAELCNNEEAIEGGPGADGVPVVIIVVVVCVVVAVAVAGAVYHKMTTVAVAPIKDDVPATSPSQGAGSVQVTVQPQPVQQQQQHPVYVPIPQNHQPQVITSTAICSATATVCAAATTTALLLSRAMLYQSDVYKVFRGQNRNQHLSCVQHSSHAIHAACELVAQPA